MSFALVSILSRYLVREVAKPILVFFFVLTAIFTAYSASEFLGKAAQGLIRVETIATLVFLKSIIAMEVLLPIATFLTVVVGVSRLGSNYELTAMSFCGFSRLRLLRALSLLFVLIALAVACLSIWARPRVYAETYRLLSQAKRQFNLEDVQDGVFLGQDEGKTVIFVEGQGEETKEENHRGVFVFLERKEKQTVLMAKSVRQVDNPVTGDTEFIFSDMEGWQLGASDDSMTIATEELSIPFSRGEKGSLRIRRKATPTLSLNRHENTEDLAEFQWRISRPISTLILGFLAVGLASFVPRRDRYKRLLLAVIIYIIYFNLQALAKTWVEQGIVGPIPGIFWVDGLVATILTALFLRSRLKQGSRP